MTDELDLKALLPPKDEGDLYESLAEDYFIDMEIPGTFMRGLKTGIAEEKAILEGVAAQGAHALDLEGARDQSARAYLRHMDEAAGYRLEDLQSLYDVEGLGDLGEYALFEFARAMPMLATVLAGGGVGGVAGRAVAKRAVKEGMDEVTRKELLNKGTTIGAGAGVAPASTALESGSVFMEAADPVLSGAGVEYRGELHAGKALATGALAATFDVLPIMKLLERYGLAKRATKDIIAQLSEQGYLKRAALRRYGAEIGKQAGLQAIYEGTTESFQVLVNQLGVQWIDANRELVPAELVEQMVNANFVGTMVGGALGAPAGVPRASGTRRAVEAFDEMERHRRDVENRTLADRETLDPQMDSVFMRTKEGLASLRGEAEPAARFSDDYAKFTAGMDRDRAPTTIVPASQFDQDTAATRIAEEPANWQPVSLRKYNEQVDTPEFKRWFGNSRMVDERGQPVVLYHATTGDFDTFKFGDLGYHVGTIDQANVLGRSRRPSADKPRTGENIMPVFVRLEKPLQMPDMGADWTNPFEWSYMQNRAGLWASFAKNDPVAFDDVLRVVRSYTDDERARQWLDGRVDVDYSSANTTEGRRVREITRAFADDVTEVLKKHGYDGIEYQNIGEAMVGAPLGASYVLFDASQIKSATGNRGTFDPREGSIVKEDEASIPRPKPPEQPKTLGAPEKPIKPAEAKPEAKPEPVEPRTRIERIDRDARSGEQPTKAQLKRGDKYKKGRLNPDDVGGLPIDIETPEGVKRHAKPDAERQWERRITGGHYGEIRRTKGADGEGVDVFVGPDRIRNVYVIDQMTDRGEFDEHKVMLGYSSADKARKVYLSNYPKGWESRIGNLRTMTLEDFKRWLEVGDQQRPVGDGRKRAPETKKQSKARSMVAHVVSLIKRLGERGSLLASKMAKDYKDHGAAPLIGQQIKTSEDLAVLAQIYRNPNFETFRVVYVDDKGRVAGQSAMSSRIPGQSSVFLRDEVISPEQLANRLNAEVAEYGAAKVYMLHNHPSGDPDPSDSDLGITRLFGEILGSKLAGHVIVNQTEYGYITRRGLGTFKFGKHSLPKDVLEDASRYDVNDPIRPSPLLDLNIGDPAMLAAWGKKAQVAPDMLVLIATAGASGKVVGVAEIPWSAITDQMETSRGKVRALGMIRQFARLNGAVDLFAYNWPAQRGWLALEAVKNDVFRDIHLSNGRHAFEVAPVRGDVEFGREYRITERGDEKGTAFAQPFEPGVHWPGSAIKVSEEPSGYARPGPMWYSQMAQVLEKKLPKSMNVSQAREVIANLVKKGEFKREEYEVSGVDQWLENMGATAPGPQADMFPSKKKISRDEVVEFVRNSTPYLDEVVYAGLEYQEIAFVWETVEPDDDYLDQVAEDEVESMRDVYYDEFQQENSKDDYDDQDEFEAAFEQWLEDEKIPLARELAYESALENPSQEIAHIEFNGKEYTVIRDLDFPQTNIYEGDSTDPGFKSYSAHLETLATNDDAEIEAYFNEGGAFPGDDEATKYAEYTEPGGDNYTELLMTLPETDPQVSSPHWDDNNVLMHIRFKSRMTGKAGSTLFIEELQSDWHQEGREKGYRSDQEDFMERLLDDVVVFGRGDNWQVQLSRMSEFNATDYALRHDFPKRFAGTEDRAKELAVDHWITHDQINTKAAPVDAVPDAPWKKTQHWTMLGMKRIIRWAAEKDFSAVGWTAGHVQDKRYRRAVREHVRSVEVYPKDRVVLISANLNNRDVLAHLQVNEKGEVVEGKVFGGGSESQDFNQRVAGQHINAVVGREIGDLVMAEFDRPSEPVIDENDRSRGPAPARPARTRYMERRGVLVYDAETDSLTPPRLTERTAFEKFYDQMLVNEVNKYIKKWGSKVEQATTHDGIDGWMFPITDKMKKAVLGTGQSIFEPRVSYTKSKTKPVPMLSIGALPGVEAGFGVELTPEQATRYWKEITRKMLDNNGQIKLLKELGIVHETQQTTGVFGGAVEPGMRVTLPFSDLEQTAQVGALLGDALMQDWVYATEVDVNAQNGGLLVTKADGKPFTKVEIDAISKAAAAADQGMTIAEDWIEFFDDRVFFTEGYNDQMFDEWVGSVDDILRPINDNLSYVAFGMRSEPLANDRLSNEEAGDAARYSQKIKALHAGAGGSPDLQARADHLLYDVAWKAYGKIAGAKAGEIERPRPALATSAPSSAQVAERRAGYESEAPAWRGVREDSYTAPNYRFVDWTLPDEDTRHWLLRLVYNKFDRVKTAQNAITQAFKDQFGENHTIPDDKNFILNEELHYSKVEGRWQDFDRDYIQPFVDALAASKVDYTDLVLWLKARHAPERNAHIAKINPKFNTTDRPGSGWSDEKAARIERELIDKYGREKLDNIARHIYAMNAHKLQMLYDGGLISTATYDKLQEYYENYVPLQGFEDEAGNLIAGRYQKGFLSMGKGFDIRPTDVKRALGRSSEAYDPIAYTIGNAYAAMARVEKNNVMRSLKEMIETYPNDDVWETALASKQQALHLLGQGVSADEVAKRTGWKMRNGVLVQSAPPELSGPIFDERSGEVRYGPAPFWKGDDHIVSLMIDGEQHLIYLKDDLLARAVKNLGPERSSKLVQLMGRANRFLAAVNTSYSPEFIFSNFLRDIQTAFGVIRAERDTGGTITLGVDPSKLTPEQKKAHENFARGVLKMVPDSVAAGYEYFQEIDSERAKLFREFVEDGGKIGFYNLRNIESIRDELMNTIDVAKGTVKGNAIKYFRTVGRFIANVNGAIENGIRFATYRQARKAGISRAQAASISKNLTVNFNRKGELSTLANSMYLFFNAGLQGSARLIQLLVKSRKARMLAGEIMFAAFIWSHLQRLLAGEDEEGENYYDSIEDWVKERNLIIMMPGRPGEYIKIPLPYGFNVPYVMGVASAQVMPWNDNAKTIAGSALFVFDAIMGSFNPLGSDDSRTVEGKVAKLVSPTILDPVLALALNENFIGNPIRRDQLPYPNAPKLADSHLYFSTVSPISKAATQWVNDMTGGNKMRSGMIDISPETIDYIFDFATGSAGRFARQTLFDAPAIIANPPDEIKYKQIPILRRFAGEKPEWLTTRRYYDNKEVVQQLNHELKYLKEAKIDSRPFRDEYGPLLKLESALRRTESQLRKLRKKRRATEVRTDLDDKTRQKMLDNLDNLIERRQRSFNRRVSEAREKVAASE